jgi:hypothetical protein
MPSPLRLSTVSVALLWSIVYLPAAQTQTNSQSSPDSAVPGSMSEIDIPGPLRSIMRMAGISQKASKEEFLPLFARNVYVQGYEGWRTGGRPTEFLILLTRYVNQAKELSEFAGPSGVVHLDNCDDAPHLFRVLGYRLRQQCGQNDASLITADAERAFLTTDSGFPLPALEETLRKGKEFNYNFPSSRVPVLFSENEWMQVKPTKKWSSLLETLLHDPELSRLYWAMYRMDPETRDTLRESIGLRKLLPYAAVLDFYGSHICTRAGRVLVPGGAAAEAGWEELVGASPNSPDFVLKLLAKDKGWLAAYYDSMSRINPEQQEHFVNSRSLRMYYMAFRGSETPTDAARPAFRPAPGLLLLLTRARWDGAGQPLVPGGLDVWKEILAKKSDSKTVREWGKHAAHMKAPEQLMEAMFAFSRVDTNETPLQQYLMFSELAASRPAQHDLQPETYRLLAKKFDDFSDQYPIFSEFPELNDASVTEFVHTAESLDKISNHTLRGNAMGTFQACMGLWEILARQGQIARANMNESWQGVIGQFAKTGSPAQLFDAGEKSVRELATAASGRTRISQDELIELLAGPNQLGPEAQKVHEAIANQIRSVMDGQRLVSLDTLLALSDGLNDMARGGGNGSSLLLSLAGELREFEMPRPIFTPSERSEWAAGIYNNRHTELQMQTDLAKVLKSPTPTHAQLEEARSELAPFLRDNLVGLNYAYYEPPGAQMMRVNPLFVRSHDFAGETVSGVEGLWHAPQLFGEGSPAGGGAHLVGSLADLAYVLSEAEQDFIAPENVQALIWREAVPGLLTDAVFPRWWNVSRNELHAVTLYQLAGEELIGSAASNEQLRLKVMEILSERMSPRRAAGIERSLRARQLPEALAQVAPADTFYLTAEFRRRFRNETEVWGGSGEDLDRLLRTDPADVNWERISRDFGVPHRTLAQSYSCELLNVEPFPAFSGYSSRLMAESWDSNNLYWARLADEKGYAPVMLNRLVPELTRHMVTKIFATDFEDWGALLRAMRETGDDFKQGKIIVFPSSGASTEQSAMR